MGCAQPQAWPSRQAAVKSAIAPGHDPGQIMAKQVSNRGHACAYAELCSTAGAAALAEPQQARQILWRRCSSSSFSSSSLSVMIQQRQWLCHQQQQGQQQ